MKSLCGASKDDKFVEFWKREIGLSVSRTFSRRIAASEGVVKQLDLYGKLKGHQGCVNTISFNSLGDTLVSGSDDKQVILWDWATKTSKLSYPSGHFDNIFQAKFMPFTDDRNIITSSADGQVRLGQVLENGDVDTKRLAKHGGRVHSLAVEPGSPYIFYSCGEDGFVQHIMDANKQGREGPSLVTLTPDMILHILHLSRMQAMPFLEEHYERGEAAESEEEGGGGDDAIDFGYSEDDDSEEGGNSIECDVG
ncbi:unnamed protein product [Cuscuta epithymum]|uniref:Uncharacterized protein n=1 Tax=Cuscuta epithymum TaxID=186058 RepID=A0AAV0DU96_9ASTE|nr:unnamed protein product [Cuscuta epithymum]CAH9135428.1 unnamed protein product [Cuscuta epithymum]